MIVPPILSYPRPMATILLSDSQPLSKGLDSHHSRPSHTFTSYDCKLP